LKRSFFKVKEPTVFKALEAIKLSAKRVIRFLYRKTVHQIDIRLSLMKNLKLLHALKTELHTNTSPKRLIAIVMVEHIGDIVASEPVSRYARENYPNDYIVWLVRRPYLELIECNPNIDQAVVVECLTEWNALKKKRLFDETIDLHIQARACAYCLTPLEKTEGNLSITVENYLEFGSLLYVGTQVAGIPELHDAPQLYLSPAVAHQIDAFKLPEKFMVIHCLSNETTKDWDSKKWHELIDWIWETHRMPVVEVGLTSLFENPPEGHLNYCGKSSILETAEVIKRAVLFIGIDSGPAHLANAVGTFGIVLFGKHHDFVRYQPYTGGYADGTNATLIYTDGKTTDISVSQVAGAIDAYLHRRMQAQ
jgi:ADP-heptose:LPS heptosyltransferase